MTASDPDLLSPVQTDNLMQKPVTQTISRRYKLTTQGRS